MMDFPLTIIEPGIGQWRSADIDADEVPAALRFHDDISISPLEALFAARVTRVDTALDMAFLDLGEGRTGMLNFRRARLRVKGQARSINDCVREGELFKVQVVAEPATLEAKALPVTPRPRLAGQYVVVESGNARLNFSKDLSARKTKELKEAIGEVSEGCAVVVRSRAAHVSVDAVAEEIRHLSAFITAPVQKPGFLFGWTPDEKALLSCPDGNTPVYIEGGSFYADTKALVAKRWPDLHARLQPYKGDKPAFESLGVEEAIEEAVADRIDLPSGGWISITPTPAMTVVDVNMGGALKSMAAGEAKLVVNMEATLALAHHLRFQDIGGLVVVDYIDMSGKGHARELMRLIERAFREDPAPVQHTGISAFGLVEFTRRRSGLSLRDRMLVQPAARTSSAAAGLAIIRKAVQAGLSAEPGMLHIAAAEKTAKWLHLNNDLVKRLENTTGRQVSVETSSSGNIDIDIR